MNATNSAIAFATLLGLFAAGCGKSHPPAITSGALPGTILEQPDPLIGSRTFVVDENNGGQSSSIRLRAVWWGRLAEVHDVTGELQNTNMVIGEDIRTDNFDFVLSSNAVTEAAIVTILHTAGTPEYINAFRRLDQNLTPVSDRSLEPTELPPFTLLPRNAALVLKFDDLLDSNSIRNETLRVVTGYPAVTPFDYRPIPDVNHGDLFDANGDGVQEFHTTRAILDMTVSAIESGQTAPPLPINNLGLPASLNISQANVGVRIPTLRNPGIGQTTLLTNLSGAALSFTNNGSSDPDVTTHDIVRAMRSGGSTPVTGDPNNGFLLDEVQPKIIGSQPVSISTPTGAPGDWVTTIDYVLDFCAIRPKVGDVIQQPGVFAEVTQAPNPPLGGTVIDVHFRVIFPPSGAGIAAGPAEIYSTWDPVENFGKQGCFVRYSSLAPGGTTPGQGVSSDGRVLVRFSEPMDPATVSAFDNFPILRTDPAFGPATARQYVVGEVLSSADLKVFSFAPTVNFKHTQGSSNDRYWVQLGSGVTGPTDLSGNPISNPLPSLSFTIDPNDVTENNGGLVFRFSSLDELDDNGDGSGAPEWRGQYSPDLNTGRIVPRPVTRTSATCDRTIPVPGAMPIYNVTGLQTPLAGRGSKLQQLWRYCDVGYALLDESLYNIDVEHLYWAPAGGNVVGDTFDLFEVRLSHTKRLPDETIDPLTGLPVFPDSGLVDVYNDNLLDSTNDPQAVVYPRQGGYVIDPAQRRPSGTGAEPVMPYPLNEGIPVSDYLYYTWRDTALRTRGAIGAQYTGTELVVVVGVTGTGTAGCPWTNVIGTPTVGLPLLMEFRCFPDTGALGLNSLDTNFAVVASSRPNFRAFSTGGTNSSGQTVIRNPDLEEIAHGGFNPGSNPPGLATQGVDNCLYLGQADLVLRVNRMYSIWLDSQFNTPTYLPPVVEPRPAEQPLGTSVQFAYRGATSMSPAGSNIASDANFIDPYGDALYCPQGTGCPTGPCTNNGVPGFFQGSQDWRSDNTTGFTPKFFQVRVTLISNTDTGLSPTISSLAFAYHQ